MYLTKVRKNVKNVELSGNMFRIYVPDNILYKIGPKDVIFVQTGWQLVKDNFDDDDVSLGTAEKDFVIMFLSPYFTARGINLVNGAATIEDLIDKEITLCLHNLTDRAFIVDKSPYLCNLLLI